MKSKITSKYQTTIPREIRKNLRLRIADAIEWKQEGDRVYVEPVKKPFLKHKGAIKTGRGNIRRDIEKARQIIGEKGNR